jgi:hypothetical protein
MAKAKDFYRYLGGYFTIEEVIDAQPTFTIKTLAVEEVGEAKDEKPVLKFVETSKGLVMNKTRLVQLEELFGDNDVSGKQVKLVVEPTKVGNRHITMVVLKEVS